MKRILAALRLIPFTQILLLTIAVLLYLNWQEQRNTSYKVDELDNDLLRYLPQIAHDMPGQ
jgi:Na+/phosphate symporter